MLENKRFSFLGLPLDPLTTQDVLDKIKLYLSAPPRFIHLVSINPENVVVAHENPQFKSVCLNADLALSDGMGVLLGARLLGNYVPERVQGSVLLPKLLDLVGAMGSTGALIGSQANLADSIAQCYSRTYPKASFIGVQGYVDCRKPTQQEEEALEAIVRSSRPQFVFVAFGSPFQELWIESHKKLLEGCICMGVGGAFDYLSGATQRPPSIIRSLGLEWLYRLLLQPWRVKRQGSRLPRFIGLVVSQWFWGIIHPTHAKKSQGSI